MPVETTKTLTPQMRRILLTANQRGGSAEFLVSDVNERSVQTLERRGLITCTTVRQSLWRPSMRKRNDSATVGPIVAFRVSLTPLGTSTVDRIGKW